MDDAPPDPSVDEVEDWRPLRFLALGFELERATEPAANRSIDWHQVDELIQVGCSPETALRILL